MRLVIARCSVDYEGRLNAHLPEATRLLMIKTDGSVSIHADGGAYKPLNWMNAPNDLVIEGDRWVVSNSSGEKLVISLHDVISDTDHFLGDDPGLEKDGVEAHLQALLAEKPWILEDGLQLIRREYPTDIGPVDLLCTDTEGRTVAVEVKRRAELTSVEQLTRYLERLNHDPRLRPVRGVLAAQTLPPQTSVLAESRDIRAVVVDYEGLKDAESSELKLF